MKIQTSSLLVSFTSVIISVSANWEPKCGRICIKGMDCKLENKGPGSRTFSGTRAAPGMFPWMAGIRVKTSANDDGKLCGGTIINRKMILTAASCFTKEKSKKVIGGTQLNSKIYVGFPERLVDEGDNKKGQGIFEIKSIEMHPRYRSGEDYEMNNAAILILKKPIVYDPSLKNEVAEIKKSISRPACFSTKVYEDRIGRKKGKLPVVSMVSGYGGNTTDGYDNNEAELSFARMKSTQMSTCANLLKTTEGSPFKGADIKKLSRTMMCAMGETSFDKKSAQDACEGNDGAPFVSFMPGYKESVVTGFSSFGIKCGDPNVPSIFTRTAGITAWMNGIAKSNGVKVQWAK